MIKSSQPPSKRQKKSSRYYNDVVRPIEKQMEGRRVYARQQSVPLLTGRK